MEFSFEKITEAVKKKPAIAFIGAGVVLGLVALFVRSRSGQAETVSAGSSTLYDDTAAAQQSAAGAASNADLYADMYGLVAQSQDATLQRVESMMSANNQALYDAINSDIRETSATNSDALANFSSMFNQSLIDWGTKFSQLSPAAEPAFQTSQATSPTTAISSPTPTQAAKPTVSTSTATSLLKTGSSGQSVSLLQSKLNSLGFSAGAVDGQYGPKTTAAVKAFQQAAGIKADGIVGPQTQAALSTYRPTGATR